MEGGTSIPGRESSCPEASGRALHVLVVDDCPDNAASLAMLVRFWGHTAAVALSGREALDQAASQPPDVVFLDICMPDLDGHAVARELRWMFGERPVLGAVSVYGLEDDVHQGRQAGFNRHFVKPVAPQEVCALLGQTAAVRGPS